MRTAWQYLVLSVGAVMLFWLIAPSTTYAQSPNAVADLAARVNRERVSRGLAPYALNAQLTQAAQAHANDIAGSGNYSHTGSDGSTVFDRVARTAFGAYSWGRRLGENWAWYHDAAAAMAAWMESEPHRNNILHPLYREIGVGIAPSKGNTIFVVDFGAEPNVLPIFIDDAAAETQTQAVTLTLTNEDVMPNGDGPKNIGRATQVQISNTSDWTGAQWQPYAQQVPWTLAAGGGAKTVYVKYRDAAGRTVTASDSIVYAVPVTATPRPTSTITRTPKPTATMTPSPLPMPVSATPTDTATPEPTQTETATAVPDTPTPTILPSAALFDRVTGQNAIPVSLVGLGITVMLIVLGAVNYFASRSDL